MTNDDLNRLRAISLHDQEQGATAGQQVEAVLVPPPSWSNEQRSSESFNVAERLWNLEYYGHVAPMFSVSETNELLRIALGFTLEPAELLRIVKDKGGVRTGGRWYIPRPELARLVSSSAK